MSQRKLPLHKRWVTAKSFDALSHRGKPPERTEQTLEAESFFNLFFFWLTHTPQHHQQKENNLFFCDKNTSSSSSSLFIVVVIYTNALSLLSLCWGKGPPSSRTFRFSITNHTKRRTLLVVVVGGGGVESGRSARSTRNANRFDSRFWKHTNHHRKLEIFIRRRHAFTFARRRGGERGRRDRGTRRRRDRKK